MFAVFVNFAQLLTPPLLTLCRVRRISFGDVKMTDLSILLEVVRPTNASCCQEKLTKPAEATTSPSNQVSGLHAVKQNVCKRQIEVIKINLD